MTEPYVRPDVRAYLDRLAKAAGPKMSEVGAPEARRMSIASVAVNELPVPDLAVIRDIEIAGPAGPLQLRLFDNRENRAPGPVMLYAHGGGFVLGDLDTHASICGELAVTLDIPVVAVHYRLAPEHPYPAATEDTEAAARWIASGARELDRGVTGLVLSGDSAGGNLAIVAAIALRADPAAVPVLALFAIYPGCDLNTHYESEDLFSDGYFLTSDLRRWFHQSYAADPSDWRGSPLLADMTGMPPTVVLTAGLDPLRDQGRALAAACIQKGVPTIYREAVGNIHGFCRFRKAVPSGQGDLAGALAALKSMIVEAEGTEAMAQAAE